MGRLFVWLCAHCSAAQEIPEKAAIGCLKHGNELFICSSCGRGCTASDIDDWDVVVQGETSHLAEKARKRRGKP